MSAIDEMYKKYRVEKRRECDINRNCWSALSFDCKNCSVEHDKIYPHFTAEKQIELIKLISTNKIDKNYKILEIDKDEIDSLFYFSLSDREDRCQSIYVSDKDFAQALAKLTIALFTTGNLDKEKIKEILER